MKGAKALIPWALLLLVLSCARMDVEEAPPDPEAVHIGVLASLSASYGGFGRGVELAARLATEEINQAGGVNGRRLDVVVANDMALASVGVLGAQRLVSAGAVGIVGAAGSSVTLAVANHVTIPLGIPLISPSSSSPAITRLADNGTVWRTVPSDTFLGAILATEIRAQGIDDAGVIYIDNAYGAGLAEVFRIRFAALGGTVRSFVPYADGKLVGFGQEVSKLFASGIPKGVVMIGYITDSANLTRDIQQADPTPLPRFFSVDAPLDPAFLLNASPAIAEGMQGTVGAPPVTSASYLAFSEHYRQTIAEEPPLYTEGSYDAVYLMALAMAAGGTNTKEAIIAHLQSISNPSANPAGDVIIRAGEFAKGLQAIKEGKHVDYQGATGDIDFDANGDVTKGTYIWWKVVRNASGQLVTVTQKVIRFP